LAIVLPEQRVSDAERDRVATVLREAYADGRPSHDELAVRTQSALEARTDAELEAIVADLGEPQAAWISPRTHAALFLGGSAAAWLTWFLTRVPDPAPTDLGAGYYWPVWVMLVWGALLVVHTFVAASGAGRTQGGTLCHRASEHAPSITGERPQRYYPSLTGRGAAWLAR
jgi:DUF1707 SHOCT-like domain